MELTVDSGAAENVMPESWAPKIQAKQSEEQNTGEACSAANGECMPNREEKPLKLITREEDGGHQ